MTRDERIRERLFPGAEPFHPEVGGYTALPFVLRRVQWMFEARTWQIFTYVLMRLGPSGVGWLTFSEMAWDLDFRSIPKLRVYVDRLVRDGWLLHSSSRAREYFFAPDPIDLIRRKAAAGLIADDRADAIDEVLESLGWPPLSASAETAEPNRRRRRQGPRNLQTTPGKGEPSF